MADNKLTTCDVEGCGRTFKPGIGGHLPDADDKQARCPMHNMRLRRTGEVGPAEPQRATEPRVPVKVFLDPGTAKKLAAAAKTLDESVSAFASRVIEKAVGR